MAATGTAPRVRLNAAETTGSTRTFSSCGSDAGLFADGAEQHNATVLLNSVDSALNVSRYGPQENEDMRSFVARLEQLHSQQRSPQQPNPQIDAELSAALMLHPAWRPKMAVATKSASLRKKILSTMPDGGRSCGSATLGFTHPWRQSVPQSFTDHNWPTATFRDGLHHLPGGDDRHERLLRAPADQLAHHPLLTQSPFYSIPRTKRFPGTKDHSGEVDAIEMQKRGNPGPGAYSKSQPRGTAFSVDGGETVVLGANHTCPWKSSLGHNINPVHVDATSVRSAPCYSFSKTRRTCSETALGHGLQDGGPAKTDAGCLSPGPVYEHYGTFQPAPVKRSPGTIRRRVRSSSSAAGVRMVPAPPPEERVMDVEGTPQE